MLKKCVPDIQLNKSRVARVNHDTLHGYIEYTARYYEVSYQFVFEVVIIVLMSGKLFGTQQFDNTVDNRIKYHKATMKEGMK